MKTKRHKILYFVFINVIVLFVSLNAFIYSEQSLGGSKHEYIQQLFRLELDSTSGWQYYRCSRWSFIDDTYYLIRNPFVRLFDISDESDYTAVILFLAENEYTFHHMRDNIKDNEVLVKQNIDYRGMDVELRLSRSNTRVPYCTMDFKYNTKYYRVSFYPNGYHKDLQFFASGSEIHPDILDVYLRFLDEILV